MHKATSSFLTVFVLLAAGTVSAWVLYDMAARPLLSVNVTGVFAQVSREELEKRVAGAMEPGFFSVDVGRIRETAMAMPWVRSVTVRRVWPDSLDIEVEERQPLARWQDDELLEADGERFRPAAIEGLAGLPRFSGPEGSHRRVLDAWRQLRESLVHLPGGEIRKLHLSAQGHWYLTLGNGIELVTDREPGEGMLMQVAPVLNEILGEELARVARIDMRYGHGFAVEWKDDAQRGKEAS